MLTVACDGRSSTVRRDARMTAVEFGSPLDVWWYRVPQAASDPVGSFAGLASGRLAEPDYAVILGWDPDAVPPDRGVARARYSRLNWLRAALTWLALALFVAAAYLHFP